MTGHDVAKKVILLTRIGVIEEVDIIQPYRRML